MHSLELQLSSTNCYSCLQCYGVHTWYLMVQLLVGSSSISIPSVSCIGETRHNTWSGTVSKEANLDAQPKCVWWHLKNLVISWCLVNFIKKNLLPFYFSASLSQCKTQPRTPIRQPSNFPLENYKKFHFRLFLLEIGFSAASLPFEHAYYSQTCWFSPSHV